MDAREIFLQGMVHSHVGTIAQQRFSSVARALAGVGTGLSPILSVGHSVCLVDELWKND